jgi:hypothetical protein
MVLRHESALDEAIECKVRMLVGLGEEEFPTGNELAIATDRDDNTDMVDNGKILGIDISSGETGGAQV